MIFQQRRCVLDRFFGKASNRLSLPNLANLSIFKNESTDADGNEIGQLLHHQLQPPFLIVYSVVYTWHGFPYISVRL